MLIPQLIALVSLAADPPKLISVKQIWQEAPHSAFGDLIRFHDRWYAVFREGRRHVASASVNPDDGKLRVITSVAGDSWKSAALVAEEGVDLRDPHLSITADGRLMIVAGGSVYRGGEFKGRQPRVAFSKDGTNWTPPTRVLEEGHWLWRVTWHKGKAYGISKLGVSGPEDPANPRRAILVSSADGLKWDSVARFDMPGIDESTARFLADDTMIVLGRNEVGDRHAYIGTARPPYRDWNWTKAGHRIGGPNFIVLPDGRMFAGGRVYLDSPKPEYKTFVGSMDTKGFEHSLILPSGGDNSYPGFVWHGNLLWTLYYSSHQGKTSIYLAKIDAGK